MLRPSNHNLLPRHIPRFPLRARSPLATLSPSPPNTPLKPNRLLPPSSRQRPRTIINVGLGDYGNLFGRLFRDSDG